jgi:uncharacterized OB-fold protein
MPEDPVLSSLRPLKVRFDIPISRTRDFWRALEAGRLLTTKCVECGHVTFPPQSDCPKCMSSRCEWIDLDRDATLLTCTKVMMAPASFSGAGSYLVAVGELKSGLRILAWLEGVEIGSAKPGLKLRLEARMGSQGRPYYAFVPV